MQLADEVYITIGLFKPLDNAGKILLEDERGCVEDVTERLGIGRAGIRCIIARDGISRHSNERLCLHKGEKIIPSRLLEPKGLK